MPHHRRRRIGRFALIAGAAFLLTSCVTGERPTLTPEVPINDPAVEEVLDRLDTADSSVFTAEYDIIPTTTGATTKAIVQRWEDGRVRVAVGTVEYVIDGSVSRTCEIGADDCVNQIDDARISDLNVTHLFWGRSFAARLRLDAARNIADGQGRLDTIAGQPARCVDIEIVGGTVVYCALDDGLLARYFGADVSIELTSYSPTAARGSFDS